MAIDSSSEGHNDRAFGDAEYTYPEYWNRFAVTSTNDLESVEPLYRFSAVSLPYVTVICL